MLGRCLTIGYLDPQDLILKADYNNRGLAPPAFLGASCAHIYQEAPKRFPEVDPELPG